MSAPVKIGELKGIHTEGRRIGHVAAKADWAVRDTVGLHQAGTTATWPIPQPGDATASWALVLPTTTAAAVLPAAAIEDAYFLWSYVLAQAVKAIRAKPGDI